MRSMKVDVEDKLKKFLSLKKIACLTAYDYATGRLLDEAGIDLILVGDSLGMVVLGFEDTTHVTMEHMLHHVAAVGRGVKNALIVGDLPIHSYDTVDQSVTNAQKLIEAGADAVKLEGGVRQVKKVEAIIKSGIPVFGHMGMLPQRVLEEGGYKKKGRSEESANDLLEGCLALQKAGVFAVVLESVVADTAKKLQEVLSIPTIGIGCGGYPCDGEIAVVSDVIGSYPWFVPPFAVQRGKVADEVKNATLSYVQSIKRGEGVYELKNKLKK